MFAAATHYPEDPKKSAEEQATRSEDHAKRMGMVRHLIDVVGLDINAPDQPPGCTKGMHSAWGTPICYVAGEGWEKDTHELTWMMLDRRADPTPALEIAKRDGNVVFTAEVEAWKAQEIDNRKCCLQ